MRNEIVLFQKQPLTNKGLHSEAVAYPGTSANGGNLGILTEGGDVFFFPTFLGFWSPLSWIRLCPWKQVQLGPFWKNIKSKLLRHIRDRAYKCGFMQLIKGTT